MNKIIKFVCVFSLAAILLTIFSYGAFFRKAPDTAASGGRLPLPEGAPASAAGSSAAASGAPLLSGSYISLGPSRSTGSDTHDVQDAVFLYVGSPVAYVNGTETRIDPANTEVTPFIQNNVAMVPVRFISESLGGTVRWERQSRTATIVLGDKSYDFTQGSAVMKSGEEKYPLDAEVREVQGRTFVPLDKFVEILGRKAFYDRGLIIISNAKNLFDPEKDKIFISEWISKLSYLPAVGSREKLLSLLEEGQENGSLRYGNVKRKAFDLDDGAAVQIAGQNEASTANGGSAESSAKNAEKASAEASGRMDYSSTNVQVQGVDEGDIVKTDGSYIYQVNKQRIIVAKADLPEDMRIVGKIDFTGEDLIPQEIYLHGQKLIIIGSSRAYIPLYGADGGAKAGENSVNAEKGKAIYPPTYLQISTKVLIYDMSDREKLRLLRQVELEGDYVSSRKTGSSLYLVANDYVDYYRIMNDEANATPSYRDTLVKDDYIHVGYDSIRYFPGLVDSNYMVVAGIDVDGSEEAGISTYLGAGQNIYASRENLYVAVTGYRRAAAGQAYEESTQLYKFSMKDAKLTYLCKGEVPGTVLNQFSMDESGGHFRIAATKSGTWGGDSITKNALYVLDDMLAITGGIEDMAPGERIYSVRFMGERAYVVTFKTVDPLFAIDLKDPAKPAILGALKIPGYSDYLHPYDENHIIGFGKDTVEMKGQAYYQGMKIALFDVTDVTKPVQMFTEMIGDRGTDSELLHNHKALLFSKEKNLLAFPVTLMELQNGDNSEKLKQNSLQYGQFSFQGAYVYSLDLVDGFKLKGRITHLSEEDYLKAGSSWYSSDKNVERIIYIDKTLYTLSNSMIKANAMEDLKEKGSVVIP